MDVDTCEDQHTHTPLSAKNKGRGKSTTVACFTLLGPKRRAIKFRVAPASEGKQSLFFIGGHLVIKE
jgi:hypothetical protein